MAFAVLLTAVLFAASGLGKVVGATMTLEQRDALSISPGLWRTIGVLELLGVLGVAGDWFDVGPSWLGEAAAVGFILLIVGAIATRIRANPPQAGGAPTASGLILMDAVTLILLVLTLMVLRGR